METQTGMAGRGTTIPGMLPCAAREAVGATSLTPGKTPSTPSSSAALRADGSPEKASCPALRLRRS